MNVSNDGILPGCFIGLLQGEEETNCLLSLCKGIPEKTHQVVGPTMMFSETTLASV